jgi:hypothetical protein
VEEVDTGIDSVSDEFDWLLDESINNCRVGLCDDDTVVGRLGDFGDLEVSKRTASSMEGKVGEPDPKKRSLP